MAKTLHNIIKERILIIDGAMGSEIQKHHLQESDYCGEQFRNHTCDLKGNNDLLSITKPEVIESIHLDYLNAGADIIETNTLNATSVSQDDYHLGHLAYDLNLASAKIARKTVSTYLNSHPDKPLYVAGAIGPTTKTASLSPDVNNPGYRAVTFDDLVKSYTEQISGLIDGGVDILLVETIFDTLNCKAALFAATQYMEAKKINLPLMASFTISDGSGRTLSGQTIEAVWNSVSHFNLFCVGLNCALGAKEMRPFIEELSNAAECYVHAYPNAGLPNEFGGYDETAEIMKPMIKDFAESGFVNIVGGCCGTTPGHIQQFSKEIEGIPPRKIPKAEPFTRLSGLDPMTIRPDSNFINIGERTNVSGSKRFADLIKNEEYEEALSVARQQVENGAQIIDVNMDEGMIDSVNAMTQFLNMVSSDPDISRVPVMIDSSDWAVIEAGMKCLQGKGIVNSISLKEGREKFIDQAKKIKLYGAAVVVMAFDESGQADTVEKKFSICKRSYDILVNELNFPPQDIIFDPNVFAIGTGIKEHNNYAIAFIEATRLIKEAMPLSKISGGISNVSFSFRGHNVIREAMHTAFLYHAINAGLDMGIVNAGQIEVYEAIPKELLSLVEDLLLNKRQDATERLTNYGSKVKGTKKASVKDESWRKRSLEERIQYALIKGVTDYLDADIDEALIQYSDPITIIEKPLMDGMNAVGDLFNTGKMFLPQVVKSARVMKKAVAILTPLIEKDRLEINGHKSSAKILLATVKGDVHDIGKNIVSVILSCNNYNIIDLGVMVSSDKIIQVAIAEKVDIIGLSGLITPSLEEMSHVAKEMSRRDLTIPLIIGGATTSRLHTAVKIEPQYNGTSVYVPDASKSVSVVGRLLDPKNKQKYQKEIKETYAQMRAVHSGKKDRIFVDIEQSRKRHLQLSFDKKTITKPLTPGITQFKDYDLAEISKYIDWSPFFIAWGLKGKYPDILNDPRYGSEATKTFNEGTALLNEILSGHWLKAEGVVGIFPANSVGDDIEVYSDESRSEVLTVIHTLRQQYKKGENQAYYALSDYIAPRESGIGDYVGGFAVTAGIGINEIVKKFEGKQDDYNVIMIKALADRLAEAFAELMHLKVRKEFWGYEKDGTINNDELIANNYQGIRPAPGYPACPDHSEKINLFKLLGMDSNPFIKLTESCAMTPAASVSGYYFAHSGARYFGLGKISKDQIKDYAKRKGLPVKEAEKWLSTNLNY